MPDTVLAAAQRYCARAEHALWTTVLSGRDDRVAELDRDDSHSSMWRRMAVNKIALDIARELQLSEAQVWRIIHSAETVRDDAPTVWAAFAAGDLDASRVSIVSNALQRITLAQTRQRVDAAAVAYATSHTPAELRRWLDRLIDRLEPPTISESEKALAERHVRVSASHQGMSLMQAWIPSLAAAAIDKRLNVAAQQLTDEPLDGDPSDVPVQPRTIEQKRADLLCAWLTNATGTTTEIHSEIAVVIEAKALAGIIDAPGHVVTPDGLVPVPAEWVLKLAESGNALWTRLLTDPAGTVLDVTHHGYQPPEVLRDAVRWRDLFCRVSGCSVLAENCDLDHEVPYDAGGATSGANLRPLCRRHHGMKGHGLLDADAFDPPERHLVRLPTPPMVIEYVAA